MLTTRRLAGLLAPGLLVFAVAACSNGSASLAPTVGPSIAPPSGGGPDASVDPITGATFVDPRPGQLDVHPVAIDTLSANVDGRHVVVTANWTSGVEPCYVLDTIIVDQGDHAFTVTLREGHGPGDNVCIEIAMLKATKVDLGELEPGTWTISDGQGVAAPIKVVVG
jgi:hypothetical protein